MKKTIGVLALQGSFAKHIAMLESIGVRTLKVREPTDLSRIDALILPGGESTTMSKMLVRWEIIEPIQAAISCGLPIYGTCAGLILLAKRLTKWNTLPRIGGLDLAVARNAYGRQIDSFETALKVTLPDAPEFIDKSYRGIFIRAPQILADSLNRSIEVFSSLDGHPVLVRQENILAGSFHPELTEDTRIHAWFIRHMVAN